MLSVLHTYMLKKKKKKVDDGMSISPPCAYKRQVQAIENEVSGDLWQLKLFLLQGVNQRTHKGMHVVPTGRYHIGQKISGKERGGAFQIHLKQSMQLFPELSGRTEMQNAISPLHPPSLANWLSGDAMMRPLR